MVSWATQVCPQTKLPPVQPFLRSLRLCHTHTQTDRQRNICTQHLEQSAASTDGVRAMWSNEQNEKIKQKRRINLIAFGAELNIVSLHAQLRNLARFNDVDR